MSTSEDWWRDSMENAPRDGTVIEMETTQVSVECGPVKWNGRFWEDASEPDFVYRESAHISHRWRHPGVTLPDKE